jgi:predicted nucleic acid-binding protein
MVAEAAKPTKRPVFHPGFRIPEAVRLTVRSLYVLQGLSPSAIGPMVHLTAQQVTNLVAREKWTAKRASKQNSREQKAIALQDARANDDVQRVVEAVAVRSEELSVRSLDFCSELLDDKDAKGLQMASGAAANFVKISRMSRGLDVRGAPGDSNGSVNVFLVAGERVQRSETRAEVNVTASVVPAPIQIQPPAPPVQ